MSLQEVRLDAGLTVSALSHEAKVDRRTIERAESGEPVTEIKARAIAKALTRVLGRTVTVQELGINIS